MAQLKYGTSVGGALAFHSGNIKTQLKVISEAMENGFEYNNIVITSDKTLGGGVNDINTTYAPFIIKNTAGTEALGIDNNEIVTQTDFLLSSKTSKVFFKGANGTILGELNVAGIKEGSTYLIDKYSRLAAYNDWSAKALGWNVGGGAIAWQQYGNSHVIIDGSSKTFNNIALSSRRDADYAWDDTGAVAYPPTLMGFNGANTYGVGVDRARYSEHVQGDGTNNHSEFSTDFTSDYDYNNSPIVVRERGLVGNASSASSLSPNIAFHWSNRHARSLYMASDGYLRYGTYNSDGVPTNNGKVELSWLRLTSSFTLSDSSYIYGTLNRYSSNNAYMVGSHNVTSTSTRVNPLYVIGSAYKPTTETNQGNMYGIGFSNQEWWGTGSNRPSTWGLTVLTNGTLRSIIGDSIWTAGKVIANTGIDNYGTLSQEANIEISAGYSIRRKTTNAGYLTGYHNSASNDGRYAPIFAMGTGYSLTSDTNGGNFFGMVYGGTATWALQGVADHGYGMGILTDGNLRSIIGANIWTSGHLYTNAEVRATGNVLAGYSDERLKDITGTIQNALDKVKQLEGIEYTVNDLGEKLTNSSKDESQVGFRAGDIQKVQPEAVSLAPFDMIEDENGNTVSKSGENYLTVKYEKITPLLVEAVKELDSKFEKDNQELRSKLAKQEILIQSLIERIEKIEKGE